MKVEIKFKRVGILHLNLPEEYTELLGHEEVASLFKKMNMRIKKHGLVYPMLSVKVKTGLLTREEYIGDG